jgi:Cu(I)/Ag(I) efflux system membrane fusion protein
MNLGARLVVPEDSVLNSGSEQYVFIDKGDGYFEPRAVKLGAQAGGYYAVSSGLKAGERVVTSANFIVDSDSRLKGAFANMGKPSTQAGMPVLQGGAKVSAEVLEPKEAKVGMNPIRILIKDAAGQPIEDAEVHVKLFMPQMGSMPPMSSEAMLKSTGKGEYSGNIEFQMAWTWQTTIVVTKGGAVLGTAQTNITAR